LTQLTVGQNLFSILSQNEKKYEQSFSDPAFADILHPLYQKQYIGITEFKGFGSITRAPENTCILRKG
jgi:hypothetical protein